jgi:hypothetical protein
VKFPLRSAVSLFYWFSSFYRTLFHLARICLQPSSYYPLGKAFVLISDISYCDPHTFPVVL